MTAALFIALVLAQPPAGPPGARANLRAYFSNDDYPASALRAEEQGTTSFRLEIGPDGRVANCTITGSSGSSALDSATCRILTARARYTPARDAAGNPVTGTDSGHIAWRLGEEREENAVERDLLPAPARHAVARAPLASLLRPGDYPYLALRARESGRALVQVVVGPAGRVIACAVERSSGSTVLDAATCRILRARARYRPARDAAGAAVCDFDSGSVQWTLPRRILIPWARPVRRYAPVPLRYQLAPGACPGAAR